MACHEHESHGHEHGEACGHVRVQWLDKEAFLHDGHLHAHHQGHWDETRIDVSAENPDACRHVPCAFDHGVAQAVPHGDHQDILVEGRLHHLHTDHCDDHGPLIVR
jgi:hypothetical protein